MSVLCIRFCPSAIYLPPPLPPRGPAPHPHAAVHQNDYRNLDRKQVFFVIPYINSYSYSL